MLRYTDLSNEIKQSILNDMLNSELNYKEIMTKYNIGNRIYKKIFDLLYNNSTVYLDRKFDKYLKHFYS